MTMRSRTFSLLLALGLAPLPAAAGPRASGARRAVPAPSTDGVRRVEVTGPRLTLGDLVSGLGELGAADIGPSPAPGVVRLITREEIATLLDAQQIQGARPLPEAVRVSRKIDVLAAERLRELAADAIVASGLRRGVRLRTVSPPGGVKVATGWQAVTATVPKPPRHEGEWSTTVILAFDAGGQRVARVALPAVFDVSAEGARPDLGKGEPVTLIVRSGLVEIAARAVAGDNADVGDTFPVTLRPSGKVVRARLVARDRALLEGSTP